MVEKFPELKIDMSPQGERERERKREKERRIDLSLQNWLTW